MTKEMEKGILDDNYFESEEKFKDDIDFMDRWGSIFGEGVFLGIFAAVLFFFFEIAGFIGYNLDDADHKNKMMILFFVILNKDFLNGKSMVKQYKGHQIVDVKTRKPANEIQCVIRNSTLILNWIILMIVTIFPRRRLGDALAGTMLVRVKQQPSGLDYFRQIRQYKINFNLLITVVISVVYSWLVFGKGFVYFWNLIL